MHYPKNFEHQGIKYQITAYTFRLLSPINVEIWPFKDNEEMFMPTDEKIASLRRRAVYQIDKYLQNYHQPISQEKQIEPINVDMIRRLRGMDRKKALDTYQAWLKKSKNQDVKIINNQERKICRIRNIEYFKSYSKAYRIKHHEKLLSQERARRTKNKKSR